MGRSFQIKLWNPASCAQARVQGCLSAWSKHPVIFIFEHSMCQAWAEKKKAWVHEPLSRAHSSLSYQALERLVQFSTFLSFFNSSILVAHLWNTKINHKCLFSPNPNEFPDAQFPYNLLIWQLMDKTPNYMKNLPWHRDPLQFKFLIKPIISILLLQFKTYSRSLDNISSVMSWNWNWDRNWNKKWIYQILSFLLRIDKV